MSTVRNRGSKAERTCVFVGPTLPGVEAAELPGARVLPLVQLYIDAEFVLDNDLEVLPVS
jgi:hypothetical protein